MIWTPLPQSQWIVITILVVMSAQTSIGSLFIKAKMRFLGTVVGAALSVIIILTCGTHAVGIGVGLFVAALIFTYIAGTPGDISYVGTLGSVTVAIIILNAQVNLTIVWERFAEIVLGILISFLVSYFIFPVRSHTIFLKNLANTLIYLQEYFTSCFDEPIPDLNLPLHDLNEKILGIYTQQRRLIQEVGLEFGKTSKDKQKLQKILNAERRVYRGINLIYYSLHATPTTCKLIQSLNGFTEFKVEVEKYFLFLANYVKNKGQNMDFSMKDYGELMQQDHQTTHTNTIFQNDSNVHTFLFSIRFFQAELKELHNAIAQLWIETQK